jgi:hypothetical protein
MNHMVKIEHAATTQQRQSDRRQRLFGFDGQFPRKLIAAQSDHANEIADECDVDDDG